MTPNFTTRVCLSMHVYVPATRSKLLGLLRCQGRLSGNPALDDATLLRKPQLDTSFFAPRRGPMEMDHRRRSRQSVASDSPCDRSRRRIVSQVGDPASRGLYRRDFFRAAECHAERYRIGAARARPAASREKSQDHQATTRSDPHVGPLQKLTQHTTFTGRVGYRDAADPPQSPIPKGGLHGTINDWLRLQLPSTPGVAMGGRIRLVPPI